MQDPARHVPEWLDRSAAYAWRILILAALILAALFLAGRMLVVVVPVIVAFLLSRALWPLRARLARALGNRRGLASAIVLLGFLATVGGIAALIGVAFAGEADQLGPTLNKGLDDVSRWLVNDSPFDVTEEQIARWREQAGEAISRWVRQGGKSVVSGAMVIGEIVVGLLLALIVTFFFLTDGESFRRGLVNLFRRDRRPRVAEAAQRGWDAAGGYLRGSALLGIVEAAAIGIALWLSGASLIVPVMVITFVAAFVPLVGAVAAGVIAVLVALVTGGTTAAIIVAVVAIVVQQLDNDLLGPWIFGKSLQLHPLVILLGIAAGGALFGFLGTFLAVPFLAVGIAAWKGYNRRERPAGNGPGEHPAPALR